MRRLAVLTLLVASACSSDASTPERGTSPPASSGSSDRTPVEVPAAAEVALDGVEIVDLGPGILHPAVGDAPAYISQGPRCGSARPAAATALTASGLAAEQSPATADAGLEMVLDSPIGYLVRFASCEDVGAEWIVESRDGAVRRWPVVGDADPQTIATSREFEPADRQLLYVDRDPDADGFPVRAVGLATGAASVVAHLDDVPDRLDAILHTTGRITGDVYLLVSAAGGEVTVTSPVEGVVATYEADTYALNHNDALSIAGGDGVRAVDTYGLGPTLLDEPVVAMDRIASRHAAVAPDGDRYAIHLADVDGYTRRLAATASPGPVDWLDDHVLAFQDGGEVKLVVIGERRPAVTADVIGRGVPVGASPDGSHLYLAVDSDSTACSDYTAQDPYRMAVGTWAAERLLPELEFGAYLTVESNGGGQMLLRRSAEDGFDSVTVAEETADGLLVNARRFDLAGVGGDGHGLGPQDLHWTPDGSAITFLTREDTATLWRFDPDDAASMAPLSSFPFDAYIARLLADGSIVGAGIAPRQVAGPGGSTIPRGRTVVDVTRPDGLVETYEGDEFPVAGDDGTIYGAGVAVRPDGTVDENAARPADVMGFAVEEGTGGWRATVGHSGLYLTDATGGQRFVSTEAAWAHWLPDGSGLLFGTLCDRSGDIARTYFVDHNG